MDINQLNLAIFHQFRHTLRQFQQELRIRSNITIRSATKRDVNWLDE